MNRTFCALIAFYFASLSLPLLAKNAKADQAEGPAGKRFTYKESAGKPRELEMFFPPNHDPSKAKVPGLILFHGGSWTGGTLSQFRKACDYFASRGLVCATAEYQMLPKGADAKLPAGETRKRVCITDAKSAIRWFKQKAPEFGIDPNRIIAGGGSAGGHIAILATTNPGLNDPADPKGIDTSVVGYLLFNPAFSLDDAKDVEVDVQRFLTKDMPPGIAFFGDHDGWKKGWDAAYSHLKELGNTTMEEQVANGQTHGFFNKDPWQTVTLIAADRFLVEQGLLSGNPTLKAPHDAKLTSPKTQGALPYQALFNGKDLSGWDGDPKLWKVEKGMIVGTCSGPDAMPNNSFLIWRDGKVKDFELRAVVRVEGDNNSGIQYRSRELLDIAPWVIAGYQCDIHPAIEHNGATYEERGRSVFGSNGNNVMTDSQGQLWLLSQHEPVAADISQWNEYVITARGNHLVHKINGKITSELIDCDESKRALEGLLAIQLHRGNANRVYVKEIQLKRLDGGEVTAFNPAALPSGAHKIDWPHVGKPQGKALAPKRK